MRKPNTSSTDYTQDYVNGIEYRTNGSSGTLTLEAIYTDEGRITPNGANYQYEYAIKDHLGNTRITFADLNNNNVVDVPGDILQENHYYPFGMNMNYSWMNNAGLQDTRYQYNGKELNDDYGLNLSDYGARWYDGSVGRWHSIDMKVEKYTSWSLYNYALNDPILFIDPDGMDIIISIKGRGDAADEQRANYLSNLQSLTNDKLTMDKSGKVTISERASGNTSDMSLCAGTELVRNLIEGVQSEDGSVKNYTVTIVEGKGNDPNGTMPVNSNGVTTQESKDNTANGVGTGSQVTFNPSKVGSNVVNADGTTGRPAKIGLAHELYHAESNMAGKNDKTDTGIVAPESKTGVTLSREELNTRKKENDIRYEQKVKPRKID